MAYRIPFPLFVSLRGELGEFNPAQLHMGRAVPACLSALGIQHLTMRREADFGVPLKTTMGVADLARHAAGDSQLWLIVGDDTAPMLSYLLRGQRSSSGSTPLRLPRDALVLPSGGSSAGYVIDDASLPSN